MTQTLLESTEFAERQADANSSRAARAELRHLAGLTPMEVIATIESAVSTIRLLRHLELDAIKRKPWWTRAWWRRKIRLHYGKLPEVKDPPEPRGVVA